MKCFVTGAAGFIGSNIVDRLLQIGHSVIGVDNFSMGFNEYLQDAKKNPSFSFFEGDILDSAFLKKQLTGCDIVFHFAANADVRFGLNHPLKDLQQNTIGTSQLLEAMREAGVKKIVFASSGSVYGEASCIPTPETAAFPIQTSLYGASKTAAEGFIQAYCEGFEFQSWIFRFVSILGERYTHGHLFDFYKQILKDPTHLQVLGNGKQKKSYLYIQDCIDAILLATTKANDRINIFNLGTDEYCDVDTSIQIICNECRVTPKINYLGGTKGWIGDNPFILLDCQKIHRLGWSPKLTIKDSIIRTLHFLEQNKWVFEKRE